MTGDSSAGPATTAMNEIDAKVGVGYEEIKCENLQPKAQDVINITRKYEVKFEGKVPGAVKDQFMSSCAVH